MASPHPSPLLPYHPSALPPQDSPLPKCCLPTIGSAHNRGCAQIIRGKQAHQHGHVELQASHSPPDRLCDRSANHSYHLVTYTVLIVSELIEYTSLQLY